ncbi:TPA: hypothetical protein ACH3X3_002233 [Trebouxia sp. C0006]
MSSEDDDEYSSMDEEEAAVALAEAEAAPAEAEERQTIYNTEALHDKLEDISWTIEQPWVETQVITHAEATQVDSVDDDLARELAFYNQALGAAQQAICKFEAAGTPWQRPPDYYAEMVKSDDHMAKVKQQLMHEQEQMEAVEQRQKQRETKKFSKAVQAERTKEKAQQKKANISDITRLRKQRQKSGFAGELDLDETLDHKRPPGKPSQRGGMAPQSNKRRQAKDEKFGFGGRKRQMKSNDASSAADMDSYKPGSFSFGRGGDRGGSRGRGGRGGGRGTGRGGFDGGSRGGTGDSRGRRGRFGAMSKGRGGGNRPGKARRAAARG